MGGVSPTNLVSGRVHRPGTTIPAFGKKSPKVAASILRNGARFRSYAALGPAAGANRTINMKLLEEHERELMKEAA